MFKDTNVEDGDVFNVTKVDEGDVFKLTPVKEGEVFRVTKVLDIKNLSLPEYPYRNQTAT